MSATFDGELHPSPAEEPIRLSVPAAAHHLRLIRLLTSGVASNLGFDIDAVDDLRIAVDELANTVMTAVPQGAGPVALTVELATTATSLRIAGAVPLPDGYAPETLSLDDLAAQIVDVVVDDYELAVAEGAARFVMTRRLPSPDVTS